MDLALKGTCKRWGARLKLSCLESARTSCVLAGVTAERANITHFLGRHPDLAT